MNGMLSDLAAAAWLGVQVAVGVFGFLFAVTVLSLGLGGLLALIWAKPVLWWQRRKAEGLLRNLRHGEKGQ